MSYDIKEKSDTFFHDFNSFVPTSSPIDVFSNFFRNLTEEQQINLLKNFEFFTQNVIKLQVR